MKPKGIVIHCSDSPQGRGDTAETIHDWHKQRGWDGIGYHYIILEDGTVEAGRPEYWLGSHCRGHNDKLGICLIGKDKFTDAQFAKLAELVRKLKTKYNFDKRQIVGHNMIDEKKTCPNFSVSQFLYNNLLI